MTILPQRCQVMISAFLKICINNPVGVGTPLYFPPEIVLGERYGVDCDIWSLGVLLYEMIMLTSPFFDRNMMQIYYKIKNRIYNPVQGAPHAAQIIKSCFKDRKKDHMAGQNQTFNFRPTAGDLLNHPVIYPIYSQLSQGVDPARVTVTISPTNQPPSPNTNQPPGPPLQRGPSFRRSELIKQKLQGIERELTSFHNRKGAHKAEGVRIDEDQVRYQQLKKKRQSEVEFANRIITQMNEESRIINKGF